MPCYRRLQFEFLEHRLLLSAEPTYAPQLQQSTSSICDNHPRLNYWPEEVARLQALAADTTIGTLGVTTQSLMNEIIAKGQAKTFDLDQVPLEFPADKGDAKAATLEIWSGVQWAGFLQYVAGDSRHVPFALDAVRRVAGWSAWGNTDWSDTDIILSDSVRSTVFAVDWFCDGFAAQNEAVGLIDNLRDKSLPFYLQFDGDRSGPFAADASPNHKMSSANALGHMAIALDGVDNRAPLWLDKALFYAREALDAAGGDDGGAVEGLGYGEIFMEFMADFDLNVAYANGIDISPEANWFKSFPTYIIHSLGPDSVVVNFNDSSIDTLGPDTVFASLVAAQHFPESVEGQRAQGLVKAFVQGTGALGLTAPSGVRYLDNSIPAIPLSAAPSEAVFESVGQVFVEAQHEGETMQFAFKAQPPSPYGLAAHIHYDAGSFVLNWEGDLVATDPGPALQPFSADFLDPGGCIASAEDLKTVSDFTLRTPGHNTITLERADGSRITQRNFDVQLLRTMVGSPNVYVEADIGDAYEDEMDPTPVLDFANRRIIGTMPHAFLVHDRVEATAETGDLRARFHLNAARSVNLATPQVPPTIDLLTSTSALVTPMDATHRLRVVAQGTSEVSVGVDSDLPCVTDYLVIQNASPEQTVDLFTLILPESLTDMEPAVTSIETPESSGFEIVREDTTVTILLASMGQTFDPGDGSAAIGMVTVDEAGVAQTFVVLESGGTTIAASSESPAFHLQMHLFPPFLESPNVVSTLRRNERTDRLSQFSSDPIDVPPRGDVTGLAARSRSEVQDAIAQDAADLLEWLDHALAIAAGEQFLANGPGLRE